MEIRASSKGDMIGVAAVEWGDREAYIERVRRAGGGPSRPFATRLVVFRGTGEGQVLTSKTVTLDPGDPITQLRDFAIERWGDLQWPVLRVMYRSVIVVPASVVTM